MNKKHVYMIGIGGIVWQSTICRSFYSDEIETEEKIVKNFIFISPNFPQIFWQFCKELKNNGLRVLGIGDCPYDDLTQELRDLSRIRRFVLCSLILTYVLQEQTLLTILLAPKKFSKRPILPKEPFSILKVNLPFIERIISS